MSRSPGSCDVPGPKRRQRRPVSRRWLTWAVAAAGVAILVAIGAVAAGTTSSSDDTDAAVWDLPALGDDGRVRLSDFAGTPVVVNFFASWCTSCRFELPHFAAAADELRGKVSFVGVNALETGDGMAMAREFRLRESGFVLARDTGGTDGNGLHRALGGRGMPITAFYDADGRLVDVAGGALSEDALLQKLRQFYNVEV